MQIQEIVQEILSGRLDNSLDQIDSALQFKRQCLAPKFSDFNVGDRVKITRKDVRPKYLANVEAVIRKKNRKTFVCDLVNPLGTRFDRGILLDPEDVVKI